MTFGLTPTIRWLFLIGLAVLTGCSTADQAHTGRMASVEISGHTQAEIEKATVKAFLANGYQKMAGLNFEKKGSGWETANYGGWSADPVWVRVRVELTSMETGHYTLGCDAFAVESHGEVGTEMEHKFMFAKRSECKKILDETRAALEAPPAPPADVP